MSVCPAKPKIFLMGFKKSLVPVLAHQMGLLEYLGLRIALGVSICFCLIVVYLCV